MVKYSLIKTTKVVTPPMRNIYEFNLEFMGGDADFFDHIIIHLTSDNLYLERFVDFIVNCKKEFDKNSHREGYHFVKDYSLFIEDAQDELSEDEYDDFIKLVEENNIPQFSWPYNGDYAGYYSLWSFDIYYYDEDGAKFNVTLKKNYDDKSE